MAFGVKGGSHFHIKGWVPTHRAIGSRWRSVGNAGPKVLCSGPMGARPTGARGRQPWGRLGIGAGPAREMHQPGGSAIEDFRSPPAPKASAGAMVIDPRTSRSAHKRGGRGDNVFSQFASGPGPRSGSIDFGGNIEGNPSLPKKACRPLIQEKKVVTCLTCSGSIRGHHLGHATGLGSPGLPCREVDIFRHQFPHAAGAN